MSQHVSSAYHELTKSFEDHELNKSFEDHELYEESAYWSDVSMNRQAEIRLLTCMLISMLTRQFVHDYINRIFMNRIEINRIEHIFI